MESKIPIVSFEGVCGKSEQSIDSEDWITTAEKFGTALRSMGFVYLRDHGIPLEVVDNVFKASKEFFDLPLETKKCYPRDLKKTYHGYNGVGNESFTRHPLAELRETFDTSGGSGPDYCYPDKEVPQFRTTLDTLRGECEKLLIVMLRLLAIAMKMQDEDYFVNCHRNLTNYDVPNFTQLRTLSYPPVPLDASPESVRCAPHTDFGIFTLLFQDDLDGLEIQSLNGSWVPATPIRGCIFVNTGDLLQFWTGGSFPSTVHRVIIPEEEIRRQCARQSIAYFAKPDNDTEITPLLSQRKAGEFVDEQKEIKFEGVVRPGEHYLRRTAFSIEAAPIKVQF